MYYSMIAAANAEPGNPIAGFLILAGICWLIWALCRPRGYDVEVNSHHKGRIRPR
jgi:hypothetical protein